MGVLLNEKELFDALEKNPFWIQFAWLRYTLQVHRESCILSAFFSSKRFMAWTSANYKEFDDLIKTLTEFEERHKED